MGIITDIGMKFISKFGTNDTTNKSGNNINVDEPKKPKIRGKALNRAQQKTLIQNGVSKDEIELYLLYKTSFAQEGADKRLNQSSNKVAIWTLIHRNTGELREVYIA